MNLTPYIKPGAHVAFASDTLEILEMEPCIYAITDMRANGELKVAPIIDGGVDMRCLRTVYADDVQTVWEGMQVYHAEPEGDEDV